ncbi:hypothetical protein QTP70_014282 [Hemibagrus guttatus]|uniref:ribonuclease H n=1 Tax=Hemibagrus guttatus TaxID=175788 RepID=A0AAE0UW62_9TELE|nr:hypothetical protein QTP70_014282 [Hemibagrus guttatus]
MKVWERVVEARLRKVVEICEQQYGFMPRKSTTGAIFALRILMEKYRDGQRELHCVFVDLEKAYDRVPREELWYCMRKSGVAEKYVRVVQDMYERSRTVVRCAVGQTEEFKVEVGLHQGSALSPFLFAIVMDQLSEEVRQESPWTMMFADDIVICSESREQVEENLERWRFALERRGMKVSRSKTEYMCVNEREGSGTVRLQGEEVKKVQEFKYLGSTVQSNGECGKEVKKRVQAGSIRLIGGNHPCSGRVEVLYDGQWGTVCDDDWGMNDAEVVCRQLGCGNAVTAHQSAHFGQGSGPIFLNDVQCSGSESTITQCSHSGFGSHSCSHGEEAGVTCSGVQSPTLTRISPNSVVSPGEVLQFTCTTPSPTCISVDFSLYKAGTLIKKQTAENTTTFTLTVDESHQGQYTCDYSYSSNSTSSRSNSITITAASLAPYIGIGVTAGLLLILVPVIICFMKIQKRRKCQWDKKNDFQLGQHMTSVCGLAPVWSCCFGDVDLSHRGSHLLALKDDYWLAFSRERTFLSSHGHLNGLGG